MKHQGERWRNIAGFEGQYEVSDHGRVRSLAWEENHVLRPRKCLNGYLQVNLGARVVKAVHRLVLEAFVGPCPDGYECDHINGVRDDNRLANLHWVSRSENQRNPITLERHKRAAHGHSVLCVETNEIFLSVHEAARRMGLSRGNIQSVCCGRKRKQTGGFTFRFVEVAE